MGAVFVWRLLPLKTFTGVLQAHSQPALWPKYALNTVAMLLDKIKAPLSIDGSDTQDVLH